MRRSLEPLILQGIGLTWRLFSCCSSLDDYFCFFSFSFRRIVSSSFFAQLFMACLCNLQAAQILNEIDTERLFSNLPEIYVANRQFWADHVFPMLRSARCARAPLDPTALREGFLKFDELFHPYTKYCLDQSQCQSYCKEKDHDNELFKAYLAVSFQFPFFLFVFRRRL